MLPCHTIKGKSSDILAFIIKRKLLHKIAAAEQARGVNTTCHSKGPKGGGGDKAMHDATIATCMSPTMPVALC